MIITEVLILALAFMDIILMRMSEPEGYTNPRDLSTAELVENAFVVAAEDERFELETINDPLGLPRERMTYFTDGGTRVVIQRPTLDVSELSSLDDDPHSRTPDAEVEINAKRTFTLYLAGGERYYARAGFVGIGVFADGVFVDRFASAYKSYTDDVGTVKTEVVGVGSFYVPISVESDGFIQDLIDPRKVIAPPTQ